MLRPSLPHADKDCPEDSPSNLLGDMIQLEFSRPIVVGPVGAPGTRHVSEIGVALRLGFVEAQRADDGQTLGKVQAQLSPLEDIGASQAEEVARAGIVDVQRWAIEVAGPTGLRADLTTLVDEREMRRVLVACLGPEVETRFPGKGRDQSSDHRREQSQKRRIRKVLAPLPRLAERRLVGERT
jgi:hypothetical protein